MIHFYFSPAQLEQTAENLLRKFDPELLEAPKPFDVYAVIEKCLDVPYDWKYLTPDQSILGLTAFEDGLLYVWPAPYYKEGMLPRKIEVKKGTIIIDSTLTEGNNLGLENFTVMHEVFHQVLPHRHCFICTDQDYTSLAARNVKRNRGRRMTSLEVCEYQSNFCAATFLMPRAAVTNQVRMYTRQSVLHLSDPQDSMFIRQLASRFSVSVTAMQYRLLYLKLAVK